MKTNRNWKSGTSVGMLALGLCAWASTASAAVVINYIPGATEIESWTAVAGETSQWNDWSDWDSGNTIDASGNKVLGTPPNGARGAIYLFDTRTKLPELSYQNSGIAMSYTLGSGTAPDRAVYLEMFTWNGDISGGSPDQQRLGFIIDSAPDGSNPKTVQQFADGNYRQETWAGTVNLAGTHTMALALIDQGVSGKVDVVSYFDGVEVNRFEAVDPLGDLTRLGVGFEYTGNRYAKRGTLVHDVTAFAIPEPGSMTLLGIGLLGAFASRKRKNH